MALFPRGIAADGLLFDMMVAVRAALARQAPAESPVVIVAIDRRSLQAPRFAAEPRALFAPHWGRLLDTLLDAGARVVAFDLIFAWSADAMSSDHDRSFLEALGKHAHQVVLAQSHDLGLAPSFFNAVHAGSTGDATGLAVFKPDVDGVIRSAAIRVETTGGLLPTLAGAVAAHLMSATSDEVLLAPWRPLESLPTYALIDVLDCADQDAARLRAVFAGRTVLVGTTLADEDRKLASDRFISRDIDPSGAAPVRALRPLGPSDPISVTVPGVHVHAEGLRALLSGDHPSIAPLWGSALVGSAAAAVMGALSLWWRLDRWPIGLAVPAAGGIEIAVFLFCTLLLLGNIWVPVALPLLDGAAALSAALGCRYLVDERRLRRIRRAFGMYLAPLLVERLMEDEEALRLGGDERDVTVMFADLSGFTAAFHKVQSQPPAEAEALVAQTNRYLGLIVAAVHQTGGYVDKFVGDAVMALWGAPARDPQHAQNAVSAALDAAARVEDAKVRDAAARRHSFSVKIAVNSGRAIVGNVGADDRLNYTALGDVVNIASRLESVSADYSCPIVIGPTTAESVRESFLILELDRVLVPGCPEPIEIHRPLIGAAEATPTQRGVVCAYGLALALYRAGRFADAATAWLAMRSQPAAGTTGPHTIMAARAAKLASDPPLHWDGTWVPATK